jgi:hypothetical protein
MHPILAPVLRLEGVRFFVQLRTRERAHSLKWLFCTNFDFLYCTVSAMQSKHTYEKLLAIGFQKS